MKTLVFTIMLAALTAGLASAGGGYGNCVGNNSRACRDARNAFARHHGGVYPGQYRNQAYYNGGGYWRDGDRDWDHDRDWRRDRHERHEWEERHERHEHHHHHHDDD